MGQHVGRVLEETIWYRWVRAREMLEVNIGNCVNFYDLPTAYERFTPLFFFSHLFNVCL